VADLKFGPLPKESTVKVTIKLPEPLKEELDAYAGEHSKLYEPVETKVLTAQMLETFLRADRSWRTLEASTSHKPNFEKQTTTAT
jgi:hypothetical protein